MYVNPPASAELIYLGINIILNVLVIAPVLILTVVHTYYMVGNMTTIEKWEIERVQDMQARGKIPQHVYFSLLFIYFSILG